mgnify:CR=1 FL=1
MMDEMGIDTGVDVDKVLEIGTGSGYQAAVLSGLVGEVYTIEIVPQLADQARQRLMRLGYKKVQAKQGDGYYGWPEHAPFDAIIVTAGAPEIPVVLINQLAVGGRMVIPVGDRHSQDLIKLYRDEQGIHRSNLVGMGVIPFEFTGGDNRTTLGLTGEETVTIELEHSRFREGLFLPGIAVVPPGDVGLRRGRRRGTALVATGRDDDDCDQKEEA